MTTRYAVIVLPPSSAGAVHFTVSEVAWTSAAVDAMLGEAGGSEWMQNSLTVIPYNSRKQTMHNTEHLSSLSPISDQ